MTRSPLSLALAIALLLGAALPTRAQFGPGDPDSQGGPKGPGPGPGGPVFGGMGGPERPLVKDFDQDGNGRLDTTERKAARAFLAAQPVPERGFFGGGPGGRGGKALTPPQPQPGPAVNPADVPAASTPLYDPATLRTIFLTFENPDWEAELEAFYNSDVEVPATVQVDGKTYPEVGVHFRGASSYMRAPRGTKRSLNLKFDHAVKKQALLGYSTLNLNNALGDPSLLRAVVYQTIARDSLPAPAANLVRVVINGESWGLYTNVAQFNKDFLQDHFQTTKGARWKVPGMPRGGAGLIYLGEDITAYKARYEIKTQDSEASWKALVQLTRVLHQTPPEQLEAALAPLLDVDGALKFLAVENVLVNTDGYWTRGSDFSLYLDAQGRFHVIPHDMNEAMMTGDTGGGPGVPRGGGTDLEPLVAVNDASKPLISKLLAVPKLRERYLAHVRDIATKWLDPAVLGPLLERQRALIETDVLADTKKLTSNEAYKASAQGLLQFAQARRKFLLSGSK